MYFDTRIEQQHDMMNEIIEKEMYKFKKQTLAILSSIFVHQNPRLSTELALTLAYGYFDSYEPSETIANELNLNKLDFLAIKEDFEGFKEEFLNNYEEAQNF